MTINYTKIRKKILPTDDGQDVLRMRTGVVTAVNSDGTCDVTVSNVTLTGKPVLSGADLTVGATAQILSYRGSLLVLGTSADRADEVSSINAVTTTATVGTVASGFSVNDVRAATALSGHMVDLDLYIQRSGATITASGGNIADTLMFTLAAAYRPSHIRSAVWGNGTVSGEAIIDTDGSVTLRSANGSITSGSNVRLASCYLRN